MCQLLGTLYLDFSERINADHSILFLSNIDVFFLRHNPVQHRCSGAAVQQVDELFIVYLQECALNYEFRLALARFNLVKNELINSWNDSLVFFTDADRVSTAHRESLARPGLTISKHSRIVTLEAAEHQILHALFEHVSLPRVDAEDFIKCEAAVLADRNCVGSIICLQTNGLSLAQFPPKQGSALDCDSDRAGLGVVYISKETFSNGL